jgi:hypothetical protein
MKWSHIALAISAMLLCLGMKPQRLAAADWRWVDATPDHLPFDAIVGGRDGPPTEAILYICRASHQNGMYPGKFRPGFQGCNIGSGNGSGGGNEIAVPNFQMLVPPWEASSSGNVPQGAPPFGHEDPNAGSHILFVCRANHQGSAFIPDGSILVRTGATLATAGKRSSKRTMTC